MSALQHLVEGLDPTGLTCISVSDILQMIRDAKPNDPEGWIRWSDDALDVVTYPELANFLWGKTISGVKTSSIYYYNGSSWQLIPLQILPGSITLDKISLAGTTPFYIIQVNSAGTGLIWVSIPTAIQDNTLPPSKLIVPNNTDTFILASFAGAKSFVELVAFFAAIADNVVPVTKLIKSGATALKTFLSTRADGSVIEWTMADIADIAAAGFIAGQAARRNVGNTAWEPFTPAKSAYPTFIAPFQFYNSGNTSGWQTADFSGLLSGTNAHTAILEANVIHTDNVDSQCLVNIRKDNTDGQRLLTAGGGVDATANGGQGLFPLTADYKLDYNVTINAAAAWTATLKIVGYLS